ncbi:uncharacterized protein LOC132259593 [Phlebotomus argentipes]|uniref:uncharacterized protein LOC132259593 n=1 Tax=Phlebotomus argentipes TaxID=94469 RepID=UPI002892E450|nr:uncharacterized protein LOC132259593 [Phlebotomus argentipes]
MFTSAINGWSVLVFSAILIVFSNLTFKLRKRFPIKVNCWFCNINTRVPYIQRNSWICKHCDQYNGFTPDGDYNRDIPAQYCAKLNRTPKPQRKSHNETSRDISSNGLCESCNRNQELKVQQLASFIPRNERTFDKEVEAFRKHLDEAYSLCPECKNVLKRKLNRVKRKILSLLTNTLKSASERITVATRDEPLTVMHNVAIYAVIAMAALNFLKTCQRAKSQLDFNEALPSWVAYAESLVQYTSATLEILLVLANYLSSQFSALLMNIFTIIITPVSAMLDPANILDGKFVERMTFDEHFAIQLLGVVLSLWILIESNSGHQKNKAIAMFVVWSASLLDNFLEQHSLLTDLFFVLLSVTTLAASCWNVSDESTSARDIVDMNKSFHRIYSDCSDVEEEDESEELSTDSVIFRDNKQHSMRKFIDSKHSSPVSPKERSNESLNDTFHSVTSSFPRNHGETDGRSSRNSIYSPSIRKSAHKFGECTLKPANSLDNISLFNDTFYSFDNRSHFSDLNSTFSDFKSVQGLPTEEVNSAIRKLRIDDAGGLTRVSQLNLWQTANPLNQMHQQRPTFVMSHAKMPTQSLTSQNSWVAGGFWSGSPKKSLIRSHILNTATVDEEFQLVESRCSSQSSGFESRPNSVQENGGTQNNSRESSICGDAEISSAFAEAPQRNFNNIPLYATKRSANLINRPSPVFPVINSSTQAFIHPSMFGKN